VNAAAPENGNVKFTVTPILEMRRLGVREKILKISKTPNLPAAKATESVCLTIPPKPFGNTEEQGR